MDDRLPLRERLRQRTAAEIEAAAFALFREQGFEATTVEQIAAAAGVSARTFFRYFATKEAVVFAHHEAELGRFRAALANQPPSLPPVDRVFAAMAASAEPWQAAHGEERHRLMAKEPVLRAHEARMGEELEDAIAADLAEACGGGVDGRLRAAIVAGAVFGGLRGARRGWRDAPLRSPHELFAVTREVVAGMAGNRGSAVASRSDRDPQEGAAQPPPDR